MTSLIQYLKEIIYLLGNDLNKLPIILLMFLILSSIDLAGIGLIGLYISIISNPEVFGNSWINNFIFQSDLKIDHSELLVGLGIGMVVLFILKAIIGIGVHFYIISFCNQQAAKIRTKLMDAYQKMKYTDYLQRNSSEYIQAVMTYTQQYTSSLIKILNLIIDGIVAVFIISFLAWVNIKMLIILIIFFGITIYFYDLIFFKKQMKVGELHNLHNIRTIQAVQEGISGFKEIRVLNAEKMFLDTISHQSKQAGRYATISASFQAAPRRLLEFVIVSFVVLLVIGALNLEMKLEFIFPLLTMFGVAILRLLPSAGMLSSGIAQLRAQRYAVGMLFKDFNQLQETNFDKNKINKQLNVAKDPFKELKLTNIEFQYPGTDVLALTNISLELNAGESIGIIGPSGCGKTTLIDVLLGLLKPQNGRLYYNGRPLKESILNWRSQVAYLPQEVFLIDNSLRSNVALGEDDTEIDDLLIKSALRQSRLEELVAQLPKGIYTMLGERGVRLSGGQRQRVALARAFYHGRNILIMDEATSSLDQETEREIVEEIKRLKGQKTLIVIAHRLTTVQHCDRIYRLEKGRIIDEGSYEQVINSNNGIKRQ